MNNPSGLTEVKTKAWRPLFTGHQYFWTHLHTLDFWNLAGSALIFSPVSFLPQRKRERCYFYNCSLEHSIFRKKIWITSFKGRSTIRQRRISRDGVKEAREKEKI